MLDGEYGAGGEEREGLTPEKDEVEPDDDDDEVVDVDNLSGGSESDDGEGDGGWVGRESESDGSKPECGCGEGHWAGDGGGLRVALCKPKGANGGRALPLSVVPTPITTPPADLPRCGAEYHPVHGGPMEGRGRGRGRWRGRGRASAGRGASASTPRRSRSFRPTRPRGALASTPAGERQSVMVVLGPVMRHHKKEAPYNHETSSKRGSVQSTEALAPYI